MKLKHKSLENKIIFTIKAEIKAAYTDTYRESSVQKNIRNSKPLGNIIETW